MAYLYDRRAKTAFGNKRYIHSRTCDPRNVNSRTFVHHLQGTDSPFDETSGGVNQVKIQQQKSINTVYQKHPFFLNKKEAFSINRHKKTTINKKYLKKRTRKPNKKIDTSIMHHRIANDRSLFVQSPFVKSKTPRTHSKRKTKHCTSRNIDNKNTKILFFEHQQEEFKKLTKDPLSSFLHSFIKKHKHVDRDEGHLNLNVDPLAFKNAHEIKFPSKNKEDSALAKKKTKAKTRSQFVSSLNTQFVNTQRPCKLPPMSIHHKRKMLFHKRK